MFKTWDIKKTLLVLIAIVFLCFACKKSDNRRYSYWHVNTDSFSTNNIRADEGKARHEISGNDFNNRYDLYFNLGFFPIGDSFFLDCSQQNPQWACFSITYNGVGYINPHNAYIVAHSLNGKGNYTLKPTWFYNETQTTDSVLVYGTFNQP